jgi:hypothetical protein
MLKKASLHPPYPQARRERLVPDLLSRLINIINVPLHGKRAGLGRLGAGRVGMGTPAVLISPAASNGKGRVLARLGWTVAINDLEHPANLRFSLPLTSSLTARAHFLIAPRFLLIAATSA